MAPLGNLMQVTISENCCARWYVDAVSAGQVRLTGNGGKRVQIRHDEAARAIKSDKA